MKAKEIINALAEVVENHEIKACTMSGDLVDTGKSLHIRGVVNIDGDIKIIVSEEEEF